MMKKILMMAVLLTSLTANAQFVNRRQTECNQACLSCRGAKEEDAVNKTQVISVDSVTFRMQPVEGGGFMMGSDGGWNRSGKFCLVYDRGNYRPEYASNAVGLRLVLEK